MSSKIWQTAGDALMCKLSSKKITLVFFNHIIFCTYDLLFWAVFRCEKFAKKITKYCSTFRLYVVNIVLPYAN